MWNSPASRNQASAALPGGSRVYAIGDIHGRADLLEILLSRINADYTSRPCARAFTVFLGDYIDRGPSSKEVLNLLLERKGSTGAVFLRGNHETFVPRFLNDPAVLDEWRLCGGLQTLLSYGLKPSINPDVSERLDLAEQLRACMPAAHLEFLESLDLSFACGDFLFVHAGIRPGIPVQKQKEEDLLWIREEFLSCEQPFECFVVHGHTPVHAPDFRSNRINIDTGAFATGLLTCIVIEGSVITPLPA